MAAKKPGLKKAIPRTKPAEEKHLDQLSPKQNALVTAIEKVFDLSNEMKPKEIEEVARIVQACGTGHGAGVPADTFVQQVAELSAEERRLWGGA